LLRAGQFEQATERFYEASAAPELWPKALQMLADATDSAGVTLYPLTPRESAALPSSGFKDFITAFVEEGWVTRNPRMRRGMELTARGFRGLITDRDMFGPDGAPDDAFNNDFLSQHNLRGAATAGMVLADWGPDLIIPLSMERQRQAGPFVPAEVASLNRLMRLLRPAARLALNVGLRSSLSVLDSLTGPDRAGFLLGASGRVLHDPSGSMTVLGEALSLRQGRLSSWHPRADAALREAIERAVAPQAIFHRASQSLALPRRGGGRPLIGQVVPVVRAAHDIFMLARAILLVRDPEAGPGASLEQVLQSAFRLSPAESRIAIRIGRGDELRDIARAEGVAIETARARLKSVFAKTDTHRQAELALLVAGFHR